MPGPTAMTRSNQRGLSIISKVARSSTGIADIYHYDSRRRRRAFHGTFVLPSMMLELEIRHRRKTVSAIAVAGYRCWARGKATGVLPYK